MAAFEGGDRCPECFAVTGPRTVRALLSIRLSVETDTTSSPERQREKTTGYAVLHDMDVVGEAVDLDVSATDFAPLERPGLGGWMRDRHTEFDVIVFWKLHRAVRKPEDLTRLIEWCRHHGKSLVFVEDGFDLSTPLGKAMAYVAAVFAEIESANTRERVESWHAFARTTTRWAGGTPPYGYMVVPHVEKGRALAVDEDMARIVRWMVSMVLEDRRGFRQIAAALNSAKVPVSSGRWWREDGKTKDKPKSGLWRPATVANILRSPTLRGYKVAKERIQYDDAGMPIIMAPAIVDDRTWEELQRAVAKQSKGGNMHTKGTSTPWLGVAHCSRCNGRLYLNVNRRRARDGSPRVYSHYRCMTEGAKMGCPKSGTSEAHMDAMIEGLIEDELADVPVVVKEWNPGNDVAAHEARVRANLENIRDEYDHGDYDYEGGELDYRRRKDALLSVLKELSALPQEKAGWVTRKTGETFGQAWARMDQDERRLLLVDAGVKVYADKANGDFRIEVPDDLRERVRYVQAGASRGLQVAG